MIFMQTKRMNYMINYYIYKISDMKNKKPSLKASVAKGNF